MNSQDNPRMEKQRQMRWASQGARRVVRVRSPIVDGRLSARQLNVAA